jgi:hypothetical protein
MRTIGAFCLAVFLATGAVHAADASPLAPLSFLLGTWKGGGSGKPGDGAGVATFKSELQGKVIVRTNHADYPAANGRPASTHDDLMVIYADAGSQLKADYYDNEGHVIRYAVTVSPDGAVFVSDPSTSAPRFRLTYKPAEAGAVSGQFEIAPPGQPEAFKSYLTWTMKRAGAGAT